MSVRPLMHPFIGRQNELSLLDDLNRREGSKFLIVYGRRRVGKTRLLTHWADTRSTPILYWVAKQTSPANLLASFSQALLTFFNPGADPDLRVSYANWEAAFEAVAKYALQNPFVLVIDEFTYALDAVPELASVLQNSWDHVLKPTPLFLIVSGSQVHMMQKNFHSARAPLYGRATARLHLHPLPYSALPAFFPNYNADALVAVYAILGGMPAYLEMFDPDVSLSENIQRVLLTPSSIMQSDALLILHEQFDEPRNYAAVMEAIAHNHRTRKEITDYTEIPSTNVGRYLGTLTELGLVERRIPITAKPTSDSRKGRYALADAYLRFYFRFIATRLDQIESYRTGQALEYVREHLRAFVGEYAFEALCREWVGFMGDQGKLPFYPERIGSYWGSDAQLDVFAVNEGKNQVLVGECKWGVDHVGIEVVRKLLTQGAKGISHLKDAEKFVPHFYLFTRNRPTSAADKLAAEHRVRIVTLEELDRDLRLEP